MLDQMRRTHGKYVIATNELDNNKLGLLEMLALYKSQSSSVERGFRFLKDPLFFADSLFLKKPAPDQTDKPTQKPTIRRVFQMMEGIDLLIIDHATFRQRLLLNMTEVRWQIVNLFSIHVQKLYNL